ncbi:MAG: hypothetical protein LQ339_006869 [Xanthoria mediterranea]|nr:MAG: hypothetical protein LQ339_006869 [Xanthoria mediterranea]
MWTIECDGPTLQNKRTWLRPGQKYLYGRSKDPNSRRSIGFGPEEKSVSRKHITITVSAAKPGSGSSVPTRSEIRIQDEGAKFGTEIDGERVPSGSSALLQNDEHSFRLGKTAHIFRIKWQPVVLSVSFGSKESKAGKDPLAQLQSRLEHTDIKVIGPYLNGQTTHVVQAKRNTAKGLQALINGKHIVTETFIDALVYASAPTDFDHDESLTPLEEDFAKHWPDPMQHVPPTGKEPNERPFEAFAPNPDRANVFEGYTFVLCEKAQFESLQGPITNGGGKAMYFGLKPGQTTTDELVGYVKNVAGEKGLGELEDGSEGKGVVVVKFRGAKDDFQWAAELVRTASLALDLRFIEQNEFMDAILMNDASVLRRPLESAQAGDESSSNHVATQNGNTLVAQHSHHEPEVSQPPPQPRQRGMIKSRFKGFFDSDDDDMKPSVSAIPQEGPQMQIRSPNHDSLPSEAPNSRKRPVPAPEDDEEDFVDQLFPAATAVKRRRLEENEAARLRGEPPPSTSVNNEPANPATATKKPPPPELDIKKSLRERREAADRAAARDQENLREEISTTDIEAMRNLAVVEEFDIGSHGRRNGSAAPNNDNGDSPNSRWDPSWNGRKNFKRFRRQGDPNAANVRRGPQGVIVPLEEVKKKTHGLGDDYWLENSNSKGKRKRGRESQSQLGDRGGAEDSLLLDSESAGRARNGTGNPKVRSGRAVPRELKMEEMDGDESMNNDDDDVVEMEEAAAAPPPRKTRGAPAATTQQSRPPPPVTGGATAGGGRKTAVLEGLEESDSEDELKFRFGKKRRVGN